MFGEGLGVKTMLTNLKGSGTSSELAIMTPSLNLKSFQSKSLEDNVFVRPCPYLTNATTGRAKASMAPHRVRAPSEPTGILAMMWDFLVLCAIWYRFTKVLGDLALAKLGVVAEWCPTFPSSISRARLSIPPLRSGFMSGLLAPSND